MVRSHLEVNNKITIYEHYYITDTQIDINFFARATRSHWAIESNLHWKLDVILDEDHQRNRVGNSIQNITAIRKIVFNLVRLDNSFDKKLSLKAMLIHYNTELIKIEKFIFNFPIFYLFT